jgi:hypothetical protein
MKTGFLPPGSLNGTAASNEQKADLFRASFFPDPPVVDLSDIQTGSDHLTPIPFSPAITASHLEVVATKLIPRDEHEASQLEEFTS